MPPTFLQTIFRTKPIEVIRAEEATSELKRSLSLFDLICIGIGATVGSGVFATTGQLISENAGPSAVISWTIAGVVSLLNAFAYMELVTRVPSSGSTYAYAYHALGELPAVIAAWLLTLEFAVAGAGVARSWAQKMHDWLVEGYPTHDFDWLNLKHANLLGAGVMAMSVVVLLMGIKFGKVFINTMAAIKVSVVLFIVFAGFVYMDTSNLSPFIPPRDEAKDAYGTKGMIGASSLAFFGYIGFDEVCCLAAEVHNPRKILPIAVIGVVLCTMSMSVFASLVLSGMVPYMDAVNFSAGFNAQGAKWAGQIVHAGEIVTMPVVVLVSFLAQPRLHYALACDGLMPQIFAVVDGNGNLFWNTLISGIIFTVISLVVPFDVLWDIVSFGTCLSFVMSNSALLMVRTRKASPVAAPVTIGALVFCAFVGTFTYTIGYSDNSSTVALVIAILFLTASLAACLYLTLKCPRELNDPDNYTAPLVPLLPTISILADFYLMSQLSTQGICLSLGWIAISIVFYFVYGYGHSAGRNGWAERLEQLPSGHSSLRSPMLSLNEVYPSINSMVKMETAKRSSIQQPRQSQSEHH